MAINLKVMATFLNTSSFAFGLSSSQAGFNRVPGQRPADPGRNIAVLILGMMLFDEDRVPMGQIFDVVVDPRQSVWLSITARSEYIDSLPADGLVPIGRISVDGGALIVSGDGISPQTKWLATLS